MDNPHGGWNPPPWAAWYPPRPRQTVADPQMRVSDAERQEIADQLSQHFSDGRLDNAEFDERMGCAMSAKTRADLAGLLADLPHQAPTGGQQPPTGRPRRHYRVVTILAIVFAAMIVASALSFAWHVPWALFLIVGFLIWHRTRHGYRYRHHHHRHDGLFQ